MSLWLIKTVILSRGPRSRRRRTSAPSAAGTPRSPRSRACPIVVVVLVVLLVGPDVLPAQPDRVGRPRVRRRRQRRGRPAGRHQRLPGPAVLLHHVLDAGGHRRHPAGPAGPTRSRRRPVAQLTLLFAVGAAVIGGTSLFGGKGRVVDAVIGGFVIAVIQNGMSLLNQPAGRVYIVTGAGAAAGGERRRDQPQAGGRHRTHLAERRDSAMATAVRAQPGRAAAAQHECAAVAGARVRTDQPRGADRRARPEPEHDRRPDRAARGPRPGGGGGPEHRRRSGARRSWSCRAATSPCSPSRSTSTRSPSRWSPSAACHRPAPASHQPASHDVRLVVETVAQMAQELLALPDAGRCLGVGVSVPGAVRASDGVVRFAPNLGWHDEPFTALLSDELGMPVDVRQRRRPRCARRAHPRRRGRRQRRRVPQLPRRASAAASSSAGATMRGADGYAGEVGHLQVDSNGERCRCGAIGCWETKVGENHLLALAGRLPGGGAGAVDEVIAAAAAGDRRSPGGRRLGGGVDRRRHAGRRERLQPVDDRAGRAARPGVAGPGTAGPRRAGPRDGDRARSTGSGSPTSQLGYDVSMLGAAELAFAPLLADPGRAAGFAAPASAEGA